MRKMFVLLLTVLMVAPALAQERRSPNPPRQQPARQSVLRQVLRQPTRPQISRPVPQRPRVVVQPRVSRPLVVVRPSYSYYPSYYRSYGYGYYGGGYGYYGYGRSYMTGLKFDLDLIPKDERKLVEKGIVQIDGAEVGIVDRHDGWWNGPIPVAAGDHEVVVEHPDGRVFRTQVFVQPGQVLHVYLRFQP